jgi:hypothetical protein
MTLIHLKDKHMTSKIMVSGVKTKLLIQEMHLLVLAFLNNLILDFQINNKNKTILI